jgi:c(7)-type cytochrome triheme protein
MRYLLPGLLLLMVTVDAAANFILPPLPPREEYGTILMDRVSTRAGQQPVVFSHWLHRRKFTCRVCHGELDFQMKSNTTEISERANRSGKFCGSCHNGKVAFRHNGNCEKCHNGDLGYSNGRFVELMADGLPMSMWGNGVAWSEGVERKNIKPATYLKKKPQEMNFDKHLVLEAEMSIISPAVFPHKAHNAWLDCDNCHPDLFSIKKKGTHFSMAQILQGNYCGVCHITVAFPMDDCQRCHPDMKSQDVVR